MSKSKYPYFDFAMTDAEYHKIKGHLSATGCRSLLRSPRQWKLAQSGLEREPTAAMHFGSAVHAAILQPKEYNSLVWVVPPTINRRTNDGRAEYAELEASNKGKAVITEDQHNQIADIQESINDHSTARDIMTQISNAEVSAFAIGPHDVPMKSKFDGLIMHRDVAVDLKTTEDASDKFARSVISFGYHIQAAFYSDVYQAVTGRPLKKFIFVCVEKRPPYSVGVYELDDTFIELGRAKYQAAAERFRYCTDNNYWPDYNEGCLTTLTCPAWAMGEK